MSYKTPENALKSNQIYSEVEKDVLTRPADQFYF